MILHTPSKDILWFKLKKKKIISKETIFKVVESAHCIFLSRSDVPKCIFRTILHGKMCRKWALLIPFFAVNPYFKTRSTFIALSRCAKKEANSESTVARIRIFYDTSQFSWKNMLGRMMPSCIELQIRVKPEFNSWASGKNSLKTI